MDQLWFKFLLAAIPAGMPLLFGTMGEILTEKAGNLNLGVEGMMFMGAICGFLGANLFGNAAMTLLFAFGGGLLGALIYAFLTVTLKANQNVTGLTLTIFGTGFANFIGENLPSVELTAAAKGAFGAVEIPLLSQIPYIGKLFFAQNVFVYLGIIVAILMGVYLHHTRLGLNLRAVGENPAAADAAGVNVTAYKYAHILIGGGICGIGGAYVVMITCTKWVAGCVDGLGWIAVALVIFASWSSYRALFGSLLFGAMMVMPFYKDVFPFLYGVSEYVLSMLPYLMTAIVLIVTSIRMSKERQQPKSCGVNYYREER